MEKSFKELTKEEKILTVAKFIIKNKATIEMTADNFGISISSVKKYINNKENLQSIDYDIYLAVKKVQQELISIGQHVGGKNGVRSASISDFEIEEIARIMIDKGYTLQNTSLEFGIPTSTLYERLMSINNKNLSEELERLFDINNRNKGGRR